LLSQGEQIGRREYLKIKEWGYQGGQFRNFTTRCLQPVLPRRKRTHIPPGADALVQSSPIWLWAKLTRLRIHFSRMTDLARAIMRGDIFQDEIPNYDFRHMRTSSVAVNFGISGEMSGADLSGGSLMRVFLVGAFIGLAFPKKRGC
jgi:hypothetical protein